jgi:hypothetical protein
MTDTQITGNDPQAEPAFHAIWPVVATSVPAKVRLTA